MHIMLPGGGPANSTSSVEVWVQSDDGTFDPSTAMKAAAWTLNMTDAGAGGWRVADLLSDPALPVEGGTVRFRVEGFAASSITRVQLLPEFSLTGFNFTDSSQVAKINASMATGISCGNAVAEAADVASCKLRVVPPGTYLLAVTAMGATHILAPQPGAPAVLTSSFGLYSVQPCQGSIGGGTLLTLTGRGFDALQPSKAVVVIKVCCVAYSTACP